MNRHAKAPSAFTSGRKVALVLALTAMSLLALAPAAFAGKIVDRIVSGATTTGTTQGLFNTPRGIAINAPGVADASTDPLGASTNGYVYVVDDNNHRIQVFGADDSFKFMFGRGVHTGGDGAQVCDSSEIPCQAGTVDDEAGEFDNPQGIAINQSNGHVYVRDRDNRRVQEFEADGDFVRAFGWDVVASGPGNDVIAPLNEFEVCVAANGDVCKIGTTGANGGQFATTSTGSTGIAVDPAAPHNVFVADPTNRRVQEFEADGDFLRLWGWDVVNTLQPGDVGPNNFEICSSTVAGVCKAANTSAGTDNGRFGSNQPIHLAIHGASGFLYASDSNANNRVMAFDTDEATPAELLRPALAVATITGAAGTTTALDVEQATGNLFIGRNPASLGVLEIASPATPTPTHADTHYAGANVLANAVALAPGSDDLYVTSSTFVPASGFLGGHSLIAADDNGAPPASATIQPATEVGAESATLTGAVNPGGLVPVTYRFQYSKDGISWTDAGAPADAGTGNVPIPVQASVTGLDPNTLYRVRLATQKAFGNPLVVSPELTVLTDAPLPGAETLPPSTRTTTSAQIVGRVDANGSPTTYQFQWGETNKYGNLIPIPAGNAGQSGSPVIVSEQISGLKPDTTYHYRVIVNSPQGSATGADVSFTTRAEVAGGPERVYEMVTPPFKVIRAAVAPAANPRNNPNVGVPALDGEAMAWTTPFFALEDDVGAPGVGDRRIIRRTPQGWVNETMNTLRFFDTRPTLVRQNLTAGSGDLETVAWAVSNGNPGEGGLLPTEGPFQNRLYTRRSGTGVEGFTPFLPNPAQNSVRVGFDLTDLGGPSQSPVSDGASINDDGTAMARFGYYRGLAEDPGTLGDDDPSDEQQLPGDFGSDTIYLQRVSNPDLLPTAPKDLANECTGSGAEATLIPARVGNGTDADTIGAQPCTESTGAPAVTGSGTLTDGSNVISSVATASGSFSPGQILTATGVPHGARITAVGAGTLTLSASASTGATGIGKVIEGSPVVTELMRKDGEFTVGQSISGAVIPGGTTIVAVGPESLTLSADVTSTLGVKQTAHLTSTGPASLPSVALSATGQHLTSLRGAAVGGSDAFGSASTKSTNVTAMSNDGRRLFFQSPSPESKGLPTACTTQIDFATDCPPQLYVRQYKGNGEAVVRWISRAQGVSPQRIALLGSGATFQGASRDGRYVYFKTNAPLVPGDPNGGSSITTGSASNNSWDLYRYELPASLDEDPANGTLTRVSGGPTGSADPSTDESAAAGSPLRFLSDDGKRSYFVTTSPIAGADATPPAGGATTPGGGVGGLPRNLYLFDDNESGADRYSFVGRLSSNCARTNKKVGPPLDVSGGAREINEFASCVKGSPDGRYLVFFDFSPLTVDDSGGAGDIYLYDAVKDELVRVTKPLSGSSPYRCNGIINNPILAEADSCYGDFGTRGLWGSGLAGTEGPVQYEALRGWGGMRYNNVAVDDNGVVSVFFESQSRLVPEDTNGDYWDVYEWRNGELSLISPGNTNDDAWFSGNSVDGEDVFFYTSQRIDPREIDPADFDIYDARAGGGIPYTPPPTPCDVLAFGCEVEASAAPPARGAASATFNGEGNAKGSQPKPNKRCTKGKVRRKGKCVKRAKRAKRAANQSGRAGR